MPGFFQNREAPPGRQCQLFTFQQQDGTTVVSNHLAQLLQSQVKKVRQIEGGPQTARHLDQHVGHLPPFLLFLKEPGVLDGIGHLGNHRLQDGDVFFTKGPFALALHGEGADDLSSRNQRQRHLGARLRQQGVHKADDLLAYIQSDARPAVSNAASDHRGPTDLQFVLIFQHRPASLTGTRPQDSPPAGLPRPFAALIRQEQPHVVIVKPLADQFHHLLFQLDWVQYTAGRLRNLGRRLQLHTAIGQCLGALGHALLQTADEIAQLGGHLGKGVGQGTDLVTASYVNVLTQVASGNGGSHLGQVSQRTHDDPALNYPQSHRHEQGQDGNNGISEHQLPGRPHCDTFLLFDHQRHPQP